MQCGIAATTGSALSGRIAVFFRRNKPGIGNISVWSRFSDSPLTIGKGEVIGG
jgi:hypothetical protein